MKTNLRRCLRFRCVSAGVNFLTFLALLASTSASRADVTVFDNTSGISSQNSGGLNYVPGAIIGQVFTMSGSSENLSSLTLSFASGSSGSAEVDLYNISGGTVAGLNTVLGTVSGSFAGGLASVSLANNPTLSAGSQYAIVMNVPTGTLNWNATGNAPTTGTVGPNSYSSFGSFYSPDGTSFYTYLGQSFQMQVNVVPEVSATGVAMGFGAFAIGMGHILRRKLRTAFSSIG